MAAVDARGALDMLILPGAFVANAAGRLPSSGIAYRALNALGAGILAWYSIHP